ncbi:MAG: 50S ribosomal protein L18e [Candidatus Bathyarchaeia archaeon]|jgi:large subunit ribosomal protein L18e|nr:50S ribosomal protein L18e [Candidatus Bathyarchaeota archaeon A05DMB-4]MDH7594603.1 50S ribosomal protein L18e [Candidatus Bathyarchaeota archaeon]
MKQARPTNPELVDAIRYLEKAAHENKAAIWREISEALSKTRRKRTAVNLSKINRYTQKDETVAVLGKVLGAGSVDHPVTVAAFAFSESAVSKIKRAHGKCITFSELIKKNPKGSNVKLIG